MVKRKLNLARKLNKKMASFSIVLPCFEGEYMCTITKDVVERIKKESLSESFVKWFDDALGSEYEESTLFDYIEDEVGSILSDDDKSKIMKHLTLKEIAIEMRQLSGMDLLEAGDYPTELSNFVQMMFAGDDMDEKEKKEKVKPEEMILFTKWTACRASVDPKIFSLKKVTEYLNSKPVDQYWFHAEDRKRLEQMRINLQRTHANNEVTQEEVRELPEFVDGTWTSVIGTEVPVWFVEDFTSDRDLNRMSNAAFQGADSEDKPDVKSFSEKS